MSILNYLNLQPIDDSSDDSLNGHSYNADEDMALDQQISEVELDNYWDNVVEDIHRDSEWFSFADENDDSAK